MGREPLRQQSLNNFVYLGLVEYNFVYLGSVECFLLWINIANCYQSNQHVQNVTALLIQIIDSSNSIFADHNSVHEATKVDFQLLPVLLFEILNVACLMLNFLWLIGNSFYGKPAANKKWIFPVF
jgi:hypothetical protein